LYSFEYFYMACFDGNLSKTQAKTGFFIVIKVNYLLK